MKRAVLRIEVVSPANLGSSFGLPTLDRPTQKDSWHELPFVPDSALKGVLAGRIGEHLDRDEEEKDLSERERRFGSPDRGDRQGRSSRVVLGNGELLCFPVPTRRGNRAWVFPASLALKHCDLEAGLSGQAPAWLREVSPLLAELESRSGDVLAAGEVPELPGSPRLSARAGVSEVAAPLLATLGRLAGASLPRQEPWVVAGSEVAAELWRLTAERRTLTAVAGDSKTVRSGSLRTVELIAPGSVFLSLVTASEESELDDLGALIQLGAWESCGLGWVKLSRVGSSDGSAAPASVSGSPASAGAWRPMRTMWAAVKGLPSKPRRLQEAARAAVFNFGPRSRRQGLEAAVAFAVAKSRPRVERPKAEAIAYRWLCRHLLDLDASELAKEGKDRGILAWLEQKPFKPGRLAEQSGEILERWEWLRRHSELGLRAASGEAETPEADA